MEIIGLILGGLLGLIFGLALLIFSALFVGQIFMYFGWSTFFGALSAWLIMHFAFGYPDIPWKSMCAGMIIVTIAWHWLYKGTFLRDLKYIFLNSAANMFCFIFRSPFTYQQGADRPRGVEEVREEDLPPSLETTTARRRVYGGKVEKIY